MPAGTPPSPRGLPLLGQTLSFLNDPLALVSEITETHGPVHRIRVLGIGEFYTVASEQGVEQVLDTKHDAFAKTEGFRIVVGESVFATEGEQWERQREALGEFFYPARIRSYAEQMVDLTARRTETWTDGETLSLHDEVSDLTLDNFFATLFDRRLDSEGDERLRQAAADLSLRFKPTAFAVPEWVPTPAHRRFSRAVETLEAEARRLLVERQRAYEEGEQGDDLLSTLVRFRNETDAPLSEREIVDQVLGLTFAGHDSTAILLTSALHQLGVNDRVRERFHEELATVLDGDRPTLADVGRLSVTRRIVNETLRVYPPIHTIPRRTTRPVEIDGYRVAESERVHVSVWQVHHDPTHWEDPETWRPARWTERSPREMGHAFVPFGAGPRACIGRRFARLEAILVLATVGQRYHLDPDRPINFEPMVTLQPAHDVPVTVHER